ncbi:hypothetical protein ACU8KH_01773 [Lachancea thermotolerans]
MDGMANMVRGEHENNESAIFKIQLSAYLPASTFTTSEFGIQPSVVHIVYELASLDEAPTLSAALAVAADNSSLDVTIITALK